MADPAPPASGGYGFGSPKPEDALLDDYETKYGGPLVDTGFGTPLTSPWFGYANQIPFVSPLPGFGHGPITSSFWIPLALRLLPDDGGTLLQMWGDWWATVFRVRLRENGGGTLYPASPDYAFSAVSGEGFDVRPNPPLEFIQFALPVAPPGIYDILVYYGANFGSAVELEAAVEVVYRTRQLAVYRLREALPPLWATGPRSYADEELLD